jgi:hypothetical protein
MTDVGGSVSPPSPNRVFESLVGDDFQLAGMVAYSIYKKAKREWIIKNSPSEKDRADFHKTVTETQLELYRNAAKAELAKYAEAIIEETKNTFRQEGANSEIVAEVKRQQSFWRNLTVNVIGSMLLALLLYLLGLILLAPDIGQFAKKTVEPVKIEEPIRNQGQ